MESGVPFSFQEQEVKLLKSEESLTLVFSQRGVNFSNALRPRFTGYGLKIIPQWNTLITITVHTYMVAHKTRSSRCNTRIFLDHPILASSSWGTNPKEGKILKLIFLMAYGQTKIISLPLLVIFPNFWCRSFLYQETFWTDWRGASRVKVFPANCTDSCAPEQRKSSSSFAAANLK